MLSYARLKQWIAKNERLLVSGFLVVGFLFHYFTFRTLEVGMTLIGLGVYLVIAALGIIYTAISHHHADEWKHPMIERLKLAVPFVLQMAFGSLLSMALLFYWFSGTLAVSWLIFTLLIVMILFNESFRHVYLKSWVQVTLYAIALTVYSTVLFPYAFNSIAIWVVVLGSVASLFVVLGLIWFLCRVAVSLQSEHKRMVTSVLGIFVLFNGLSAANLIPPVPLSLRAIGVYQNVQRVGDGYMLTTDPQTIWEGLIPWQTVHLSANDRVYVYSSIYSPTDLDLIIYHQWEFYNPTTQSWEIQNRLSFSVAGGRSEGYRGYTYKTHPTLGRWRVSVQTARGQVLGRISFTIAANETPRH